jgi:ribosomal subunit interface protein
MNKPPEIVFHGIERSDAVEAHVIDKIAKLERHHPQIISCRVTIEVPHKHHQQGKEFDVRIDLAVRGKEIVVNRAPRNEDMYMALRDAFDAAKRQLESEEREHRGHDKRQDEGAL